MLTERDGHFFGAGKATGMSLQEAEGTAPPLFTWTDEPPTVPGWYWHEKMGIVEMIDDGGGNIGVRCDQTCVYVWAWGGRWAGPIPEPE